VAPLNASLVMPAAPCCWLADIPVELHGVPDNAGNFMAKTPSPAYPVTQQI
jgi:hypothetical protein